MELPRRQLAVISAVAAVSLLVVVSAGPALAEFLRSSQSSYAASFAVATGLSAPSVLGFSSGTVFLSLLETAGPPATISVDTLDPASSAVNAIASYTDNNVFAAFFSSDSAGNIYYAVFSLSGEKIVEQTHSSSGYAPPTVLYQDSVPGGIGSVVTDASGDVFFTESYPDGTGAIVELPAGSSSTPKTLFTSSVSVLAVASGKLYFILGQPGGTAQLSFIDLATGGVSTLLSVPVGTNAATLAYLAVGPSQSGERRQESPSQAGEGGQEESGQEVYYLYRASRGPIALNGSPSGFPPAELVVGGFSTSRTKAPHAPHGQLPGEIASETFTPPTSIAVSGPSQGLLQVGPSGNLFFISAPYASPGILSASSNIQWFDSANSRFSQIVSFLPPNGVGSFVVDPSGNVFLVTGGSIMEIVSSSTPATDGD